MDESGFKKRSTLSVYWFIGAAYVLLSFAALMIESQFTHEILHIVDRNRAATDKHGNKATTSGTGRIWKACKDDRKHECFSSAVENRDTESIVVDIVVGKVSAVVRGNTSTMSPGKKTLPLRKCKTSRRNGQCLLGSTERQKKRTRFLDKLLKNYDKRLFPSNLGPVTVDTAIYINSLDSLSESSLDYEIGFFIRIYWVDTRLAFNPADLDGERTCDISNLMHDQLWVPDIYIRNEKLAVLHILSTPNGLLRINSNGGVFYSRRYQARLECVMDLRAFPFDSQYCHLSFESFAYTEKNLILEWAEMPLEMDPHLSLPQFTMTDIRFDKYFRQTARGNHSHLLITFAFSREIGYYVLQVYVPSVIIVLTAFTAFWIDPLAVPARVTVGVFPTLMMAEMSLSLRKDLPFVSYLKAIDVWLFVCLIFVFTALVEYAIANVLLRQKPTSEIPWMSIMNVATSAAFKMSKNVKKRLRVFLHHETSVATRAAISLAENSENIKLHYDSDDEQEVRKVEKLVNRRRRNTILPFAAKVDSAISEESRNKRPGNNVQQNAPVEESEENSEDDEEYSDCEVTCGQMAILRCPGGWRNFSRLPGIRRVELVESACRYAFPILYLVFVAIYLYFYCYAIEIIDEHFIKEDEEGE